MTDNKPSEAPPASATPPRASATTPLEPSTSEAAAPAASAAMPSAPVVPSVLSNDHSLGQIMAMARESRGCSRDQASVQSNIPGYYLTMIESDDYSSIADQLYLLPFLRRYAVFVELDPEEVASRFIRDVQRADMNATRMSEPIAMIDHTKHFPWVETALVGAAVLILGFGIWLAYHFLFGGKSTPPVAPVPQAAQVLPQAPSAAPVAAVPPPMTVPPAAKPATLPAPYPVPNATRPKAPAPRPRAPATDTDL